MLETSGPTLETTIFLPRGDGPFPVAVINHGKDFGNPSFQPRTRYEYATAEFLRRGYAVVLPMRRGFSKSSSGHVENCNIESAGRYWGGDVEAAVNALREHPKLDWSRYVLVGQSAGGLSVMALGERQLPGLKAIINFAGGLKWSSFDCNWQANLVRAFRAYGNKNRYPTLWFYGENDSYFGPELAKAMHAAYAEAGGQARLIAYGPFENDAHRMFGSSNGRPLWISVAFAFLESQGLPSKTINTLHPEETVASGFAEIEDVTAVPHMGEIGRSAYQTFLSMLPPRAFAISPSGRYGWAAGGFEVTKRALEGCGRTKPEKPCRLYAVDSTVTWTAQ